MLDESLKKMIHDGISEDKLTLAVREKFQDIRADGIQRVLSGETSIEEIVRVTQTGNGIEAV